MPEKRQPTSDPSAEPAVDPHLRWERECLALLAEWQGIAEHDEAQAFAEAGRRYAAMVARILGTPVTTPAGAAVQLRRAVGDQLDIERWLPNLWHQLETMVPAQAAT